MFGLRGFKRIKGVVGGGIAVGMDEELPTPMRGFDQREQILAAVRGIAPPFGVALIRGVVGFGEVAGIALQRAVREQLDPSDGHILPIERQPRIVRIKRRKGIDVHPDREAPLLLYGAQKLRVVVGEQGRVHRRGDAPRGIIPRGGGKVVDPLLPRLRGQQRHDGFINRAFLKHAVRFAVRIAPDDAPGGVRRMAVNPGQLQGRAVQGAQMAGNVLCKHGIVRSRLIQFPTAGEPLFRQQRIVEAAGKHPFALGRFRRTGPDGGKDVAERPAGPKRRRIEVYAPASLRGHQNMPVGVVKAGEHGSAPHVPAFRVRSDERSEPVPIADGKDTVAVQREGRSHGIVSIKSQDHGVEQQHTGILHEDILLEALECAPSSGYMRLKEQGGCQKAQVMQSSVFQEVLDSMIKCELSLV